MKTCRYANALWLLVLFGHPVDAAVFCVGTSAQLTSALSTAEDNGQSDEIRIQSGLYAASSGLTAFVYSSGESFSLTIRGGYTASCASQIPRPTETILSGSGARRVISMGIGNTAIGLLSISNLTIRDGATASNGAGLVAESVDENSLGVVVERVIFENNISQVPGGAIRVFSNGGPISVRGNLVFNNQSAANAAAGTITGNYSDNVTERVVVRDNTIVNNRCTASAPPTCTIGGLFHSGNARARYTNNVFAFNEATDLSLQGGTSAVLSHNNIGILSGLPVSNSNAFTLSDPGFIDPAQDNYRLRLDSPLRNEGPGIVGAAAADLDGKLRVFEGVIDVGAYENNDMVFADGFEFLQ